MLPSNIYVRHEKLRHEINREISFLAADVNEKLKKKLVKAGFYYEKHWNIIICFSCGFYIENFARKSNYNDVHKKKSPDCGFINKKRFIDNQNSTNRFQWSQESRSVLP